jgi:hypothetical protein
MQSPHPPTRKIEPARPVPPQYSPQAFERVAPPRGSATIRDRIAAFEMLDGMPKEATQAQKTLRLSLIGFSNPEIASMLQTSTAVVATNLYAERKKAANTPAKKTSPKAEPV